MSFLKRFLALLVACVPALAQPSTVTQVTLRTKAELSAYTVYAWQTNLNAVVMEDGSRLYRFTPGSVAAADGDLVLTATGEAGRWHVVPTAIAGGGTGASNAPVAMLNLSGVRYVETISDVPSEDGTVGPLVCVSSGFTAPGDGGGQTWIYKPALPSWATVTNLIVVTNAGGGYWVSASAIAGGKLDVRWFGAKPDDSVDDTTAINTALALSSSIQTTAGHAWEVYIPSGDWTVNDAPLVVNNAVTSNYGVTITGDGDASILHSTNDTSFVMLNVGTTEPPTYFTIKDVLFQGRGVTNMGTHYQPLAADSVTGGLVGMKIRATFARVQNVTGLYLSTFLWSNPSGRQINGKFSNLHAEICYYGVYSLNNNAGEFNLFATSVKEGFYFSGGGLNRVSGSSVEAAQIGVRAYNTQGLTIDSTHLEGCTNASVYLEKSQNVDILNTKLLTAGVSPVSSLFKAQVVMTNNTHAVNVVGGWFQPEYLVSASKFGDMVWMSTDSTGFRQSGVAYSFDRWDGSPSGTPLLQDMKTGFKQSYFSRNNNYIADGGFEAGTNYWEVRYLSAGEGIVTFDNTFVKGGSRAAGLTAGATFTPGNDFLICQSKTNNPAITNAYGPCLVSLWAKVSSPTMMSYAKFVVYVNGDDPPYDSTAVISASGTAPFASTNWTFFSAPITPSVAISNITIQVYPSTAFTPGDSIYFDNVSIVPAYSADLGAISRNEVYDNVPVLNNPIWLVGGGSSNVINTASVPALPFWNGTIWTTGSTNAQYTPPLRFPMATEDNVSNVVNHVTPSFSGNETALTLQSYENTGKLWKTVTLSQAAANTNYTIGHPVGSASDVKYLADGSIIISNGTSFIGLYAITNAVPGNEYTLSFYALANEATTFYYSAITNVMWHTKTNISTDLRFYSMSFVAGFTNALRILRPVDATTDTLTLSNITYNLGGYWPVDNLRVFQSALDTTKGERQVDYTPVSEVQNISSEASYIVPSARTIFVNPITQSWTNLSVPSILAGYYKGQRLTLLCTNATLHVQFQDQGTLAGSLLELGSAFRNSQTLDVLDLIFDGTVWLEDDYNDN